jgi:signal-transduction protein with cAMP-binding, CBS, and nucleotidyltransferase domain
MTRMNVFIDTEMLYTSVNSLTLKKAPIASIEQNTSSVMKLMSSIGAQCVIITDEYGRIEGIFSESDFFKRCLADSTYEPTAPISQYMTKNPVSVDGDCTIAYAMMLMSEGKFRHLPVKDNNTDVLYLISITDLLDLLVLQFHEKLMKFECV